MSGLKIGNSYSPAATLDNGEGLGEHDPARDRDKSAEHIARIVVKVLSAGNELADGMEAGDDTKLLRIWTRKNEIVIFPGQCFWVLLPFHHKDKTVCARKLLREKMLIRLRRSQIHPGCYTRCASSLMVCVVCVHAKNQNTQKLRAGS